MLVKNCCFANLYLLLFCRSRCRPRHRCLSSLIFGQAHLYTFQHALVYVCPWSNTVNTDGLAGQLCRFICTQLFAWRVSKKSATIANYLRRLLVRVYPKLNLGRILAVLSFSGEIYQGHLDFSSKSVT